MSKDYYKTLGVEKTATADEIKKAFRKKAHKYHPDKKTGDETKFKEVNEAFQVIGDETKRKQYDQFGSGFNQQGGPGGAGNWEDMMRQAQRGGFGGGAHFNMDGVDLGDIFGEMFGFGGNPNRPRKGADVQVDVEITLEEAISGLDKEIHFFVQGQNGREERKFTIAIPAGIDNGQSIRASGKGGPGTNGGPQGDVYVLVRIKPDSRFVRQGADIFTELKISYPQAVMGDTVEIETIDGQKKMVVPNGTLSHQQIRLKGYGMPKLHGRGKGDQYVRVIIDVPKKVNKKLKKLLEEMEELQ